MVIIKTNITSYIENPDHINLRPILEFFKVLPTAVKANEPNKTFFTFPY
jgi:hypothetical protein